MPELPELEVIKDVLQRRVVGQTIAQVIIHRPLVLRDLTGGGFAAGLAGRAIVSVTRRGKFLLLGVTGGRSLAVNPMLAGRLQLSALGERRLPKTQMTIALDGAPGSARLPSLELRYVDLKSMGKLYLVDDLTRIPGWAEMGPDALDPELTLEVFVQRLRRHPGEIKGILVNARFVAGIGNAYADEICFHAGLYPFRRRSKLSAEETARLYQAMRGTLCDAIERVRQVMGQDIHLKPRHFLAVHGKGGTPCPRCGASISEVMANQRLTNFCRHCQPGSLLLRG